MLRGPLVLAALLMSAAPAGAATVAVAVEVRGSEVRAEAARAMVWHALHERHGHDALFVDEVDDSVVPLLHRHHVTTLYAFDIAWHPSVATVDGVGSFAAWAPVVEAREYVVEGDTLRERASWTTHGALALYRVTRPGDEGFVQLPEIALQECLGLTVAPVAGRSWAVLPARVVVPVVVAGDDEYRAFYGPGWVEVASRRVRRASALLEQANLALEIVGTETWVTPGTDTDLSAHLDALVATHRTEPGAIRIGFTQQTDLARSWGDDLEDVGRAHLPGRDLVVADQASVPGHDPGWDEADEAVVLAHELLHALGIPHSDVASDLMAAKKSSTVHRISESGRALARAAAEARFAHWDPVLAMQALGQAAETGLEEPASQIRYITGNLEHGLGVPSLAALDAKQLSPLTNVALGRYYLRRAAEDPPNAHALRQQAWVHTEIALELQPTSAPALALHRDLARDAGAPRSSSRPNGVAGPAAD